VQAFARIGDPRGAELLSRPEKWTKYTPKIRSAVIATLTARPPMIEELFRAIDRGTIPPTAVPVQRRTELLNHAVPAIRRSAVASFQKLDSGDRMKVYQAYRDVLSQRGVAARGVGVFQRTCSACHAYDEVGGKVGPDLTGMKQTAPETMLLHILVPNREIAAGCEAVTVTTRDNVAVFGRIVGRRTTA